MNYEKPEIVSIASAVEVVKGDQAKHLDPNQDSAIPTYNTASAYQADE